MVYKVLRSKNEEELSRMVNDHLSREWLLYGNLVGGLVTDGGENHPDTVDLYQALTRANADPIDLEQAEKEAKERNLKIQEGILGGTALSQL
jgi:hypothetical protein